MGADEAPAAFDVQAAFEAQQKQLEAIQRSTDERALFQKIATFATVASAAFALLKLSEIWIILEERKERRSKT
jgi:hypothetical protein